MEATVNLHGAHGTVVKKPDPAPAEDERAKLMAKLVRRAKRHGAEMARDFAAGHLDIPGARYSAGILAARADAWFDLTPEEMDVVEQTAWQSAGFGLPFTPIQH